MSRHEHKGDTRAAPRPGRRHGGRAIYADDSFFTRDPAGQAGLAALSLALAVLWLALTWRFARKAGLARRALVGLGMAFAFECLSPQLYYGLYMLIIDGLPAQWVVRWPDPLRLLHIMMFGDTPTLSAHGRAVLYWACLGIALCARRPASRSAPTG